MVALATVPAPCAISIPAASKLSDSARPPGVTFVTRDNCALRAGVQADDVMRQLDSEREEL
jgi:hypothetical protein